MDQLFLPSQGLDTQRNLDRIYVWTEENLVKLKESKTNYIVVTQSKQAFATQLAVNGKYMMQLEQRYRQKQGQRQEQRQEQEWKGQEQKGQEQEWEAEECGRSNGFRSKEGGRRQETWP